MRALCLALAAPLFLHAQANPTFEVASVKPIDSAAPMAGGSRPTARAHTGGPGTTDPTRLRFPFATLKTLLLYAYDVRPDQISGPDWLEEEHYEIDARIAAGATQSEAAAMMRNFLAQRFHLTVHRDTKELSTYSLTVAKSGLKMKEAAPTDPAAPSQPAPQRTPGTAPKLDSDGFPIVRPPSPGTFSAMLQPGRSRMVGSAVPISALAERLTNIVGHPVIDATGLTGKYDIILTYSSEGLVNGGIPAPSGDPSNSYAPPGEHPQDLFAALQSQLGLRLDSKKGPVEIVVVDHADKVPTEN